MKTKIILPSILVIICTQVALTAPKVKIISTSGDVKIRRGVEETWQPASAGTRLEDIDSILTGEGSEATLEIPDGGTFKLGSNAILDVADLRRITERELFLFLMSQKIDKIEPREEKTKLRIGDVNVVHGELKTDSLENTENTDKYRAWMLEKNGARALYSQDYITNAILKLNKILLRYSDINDCGEIHYYLGKAFESLNKPGQAIDAYQNALERGLAENCDKSTHSRWHSEAQRAIQRLKQ